MCKPTGLWRHVITSRDRALCVPEHAGRRPMCLLETKSNTMYSFTQLCTCTYGTSVHVLNACVHDLTRMLYTLVIGAHHISRDRFTAHRRQAKWTPWFSTHLLLVRTHRCTVASTSCTAGPYFEGFFLFLSLFVCLFCGWLVTGLKGDQNRSKKLRDSKQISFTCLMIAFLEYIRSSRVCSKVHIRAVSVLKYLWQHGQFI